MLHNIPNVDCNTSSIGMSTTSDHHPQTPNQQSSIGKKIISKACYVASFGFSFASRLVNRFFSSSKQSPFTQPQTETNSPTVSQNTQNTAESTQESEFVSEFIPEPLKEPTPPLSWKERIMLSMPLIFNTGRQWIRTQVSYWFGKVKTLLETLSTRQDGIWEYALVTIAYWGLTITDGAIRMLVLFQFHLLGYSALQIASLFLFYEIFGIVTNLFGGWIGANMGLRITLFGGLALQVVALAMLALISPTWPTTILVAYVMISQALSGIAKDLTKMSSKSAIKAIIPKDADATLYRWVSLLTGSKNALKGVGFFVGALLLTLTGFTGSLLIMAIGLSFLLFALWQRLPKDLGRTKEKAKFKSMFAMDRRINILSAARFFLFGARDVWFVVALPVFLSTIFGWSPLVVGAYLALWTIGYGVVQSLAPRFVAAKKGETPKGYTVMFWATVLAVVPIIIALVIGLGFAPEISIILGLAIFGAIFAINSAVHSYMIVYYAESEKVAMTIGFYYMANAGGRLIGTILSGFIYQAVGIAGCLWVSGFFVAASAFISTALVLPEERKAIEAKVGEISKELNMDVAVEALEITAKVVA